MSVHNIWKSDKKTKAKNKSAHAEGEEKTNRIVTHALAVVGETVIRD